MILYAAFLRKNTHERDDINAMKGLHRARKRLDEVRDGVRTAYRKVQTNVTKNNYQLGEYVTVFLAPEYFFARDCESQHRFIERGEKHDIVRGLANLSRECPGTVLVPGTVPWWRPLYQGDGDDERKDKLETRIRKAKTKWQRIGIPYPSLPGWGFSTLIENNAEKLPDKESPDWDKGNETFKR